MTVCLRCGFYNDLFTYLRIFLLFIWNAPYIRLHIYALYMQNNNIPCPLGMVGKQHLQLCSEIVEIKIYFSLEHSNSM